MDTILKNQIYDIIKDENDSVFQLDYKIDIENKFSDIVNQAKRLITYYQIIDKDGEFIFFDRTLSGNWGNASDSIPILDQLIINPHLIIDLKVFPTEEEFIKHYGITSRQMSRLAEKKLIAINFYTYESDKQNDFRDLCSSKVSSLRSLFTKETNLIRINSIRKEAFFNRILKRNSLFSFEDFVNEGRENIAKYINNIQKDKLSNIIKKDFRDIKERERFTESIVQQYAYVKSIACTFNKEDPKYKYIDEILTLILETMDKEDMVKENLIKIRGLKTCIATPFTAAMGGTYNMSLGALNSLFSISSSIRPKALNSNKENKDINDIIVRRQDKHTKAFIEYVTSLNQKNKSEYPQKEFNKVLSEKEFNDYLTFLEEIKNERVKLNNILSDLENMKHSQTYKRILKGISYFEIENEIKNEMNRFIKLQRGIEYLSCSVGFFSGLIGTVFNLLPLNIVSLSSDAILFGNSLFKPSIFIDNDKIRIQENLNKISTILNG